MWSSWSNTYHSSVPPLRWVGDHDAQAFSGMKHPDGRAGGLPWGVQPTAAPCGGAKEEKATRTVGCRTFSSVSLPEIWSRHFLGADVRPQQERRGQSLHRGWLRRSPPRTVTLYSGSKQKRRLVFCCWLLRCQITTFLQRPCILRKETVQLEIIQGRKAAVL